jgi:hypothetical protein
MAIVDKPELASIEVMFVNDAIVPLTVYITMEEFDVIMYGGSCAGVSAEIVLAKAGKKRGGYQKYKTRKKINGAA